MINHDIEQDKLHMDRHLSEVREYIDSGAIDGDPDKKDVMLRYCHMWGEYSAMLGEVLNERVWWCKTHKREATFIDENGYRRCDPSLGGILLPCSVTRKDVSDDPTP